MRRPDPVNLALQLVLVAGVLFMLAPLFFVVVNSFNASPLSRFPPESFSLRWYQTALSWPPFISGFRNSLIIASAAMVLALLAGSTAAIALVRYQFRFRELLRAFLVAPLLFPRVALALGAYILFLQVGQLLTMRAALLGTPTAIVLVHALLGLPIVVLVVSAALVSVDPVLEEAAQDLGAGPLTTFRRITLPLIRGGLIVGAVFAFIFSFDEVETTFFLAPISVKTLPVEMFIYLERELSPVVAALSTLLMAATFVIVIALSGRLGVDRVVRSAERT